MLFNSFRYFALLLSCLLIFEFSSKQQQKVVVLLVFSYLFYSFWDYRFISILIFSTLLDFIVGKKIFLSPAVQSKKTWLIISVVTNLSLLLFFKAIYRIESYTIESAIYIPIGISFYTFQTMSYTIDIYKGKIKPEKNILNFALYVAFFPQILAGPIERAKFFLPQLTSFKFNGEYIFWGSKLILFGLFKKVLVADKLALIVDPIYESPNNFDGGLLFFATVLFYFQIYCDFSGYTDIAIGSARLFGINLTNNFNRPYLASSFKDFWHRWHVTLSSWFRDYVYIPLGGNKVPNIKWGLVIFTVFLLSGLWHGIGLTFLLWGFFHAVFYLAESISRKVSQNVKGLEVIQGIYTFLGVSMLWVFFRARTIGDSLNVFKNFYLTLTGKLAFFDLDRLMEVTGLTPHLFFIIILLLLFFLLVDAFNVGGKIICRKMDAAPRATDLLVMNVIVILLILLGDWGGEQFIYFQF